MLESSNHFLLAPSEATIDQRYPVVVPLSQRLGDTAMRPPHRA